MSPDAPRRALMTRGVAPSGFQIWSGPGFLIWNNPSSRYGRCSRSCRDGPYWTLIVIDCRWSQVLEHVRVAAKSVELPRHVAMLLRDARAFARDQGVDGQGGGYVSDRRLRPTCP